MKQCNHSTIQQSNKGAALLITLVVVTVLGAITFTINRMVISEIKQITRLEDSEIAYQAAESGIETGLLLYRYNKNVEVPYGIEGGMDVSINKVMRVNVTDGGLMFDNLENPDADANLMYMDKTKQYYDLRIWHRNEIKDGKSEEEVPKDGVPIECIKDSLGKTAEYCREDQTTGKSIIPALPKDGTVEYDVSGVDGDITLTWDYLKKPTFEERDQYNLEVIPITKDGFVDLEKKKLFFYDDRIGVSRNFADLSKIRIESYGGDLKTYSLTSENTGANSKLDSRYTYLESTGYYGGSKRKIKVKIDRQSGSIFGVYNFVILTEGDIITGL